MKLADHEIIPDVLAKIEQLDRAAMEPYLAASARCTADSCGFHHRGKQWNAGFAKAADRLRDFATVELLCEGLGITRAEALS